MAKKNNKCEKCNYGILYRGTINKAGCQYILIEGKPRGCPAGEDCIKYKPKEKKKSKYTKE